MLAKPTLIVVITALLCLSAASEPAMKSTLEDLDSVALTVYNVGLGLVKDIRTIELGQGNLELHYMDVASQIDPTTVHIRSISQPGSLAVLEQNYEYDLLNPGKLLDKFVGKRVKLLFRRRIEGDKDQIVEAVLLSNNNGRIYQIGEEIYVNPPAEPIFPEIPENLIAKPTLVWLLDNRSAQPQQVEASYLTNGISWKADYVLVLDKDDIQADLSGWVTIDNKSGATYPNATLKLVAGDVNRVTPERVRRDVRFALARGAVAEAAPQFAEQAFFEYHLYTLQRPSTVKEKQTKQISLLTAEGVGVKKVLIFHGQDYFFRGLHPTIPPRQKVSTYIEFENSEDNQMGMPLPKGIVRVYKADADESLQFIGEDRIDHTPRDEKIKIKMGESFDVVADRKQMNWKALGRVIGEDEYESEWEITIRNHKDEDQEVIVEEPVPGDWRILQSSHDYDKAEAHLLRFKETVPANGEWKLTYRVRYHW